MKLTRAHSLFEIAGLINAGFNGDKNFLVFGINEIHRVEPGDLTFVDHPKYYDKALKSNASVILINKQVDCPPGKALIISDDPFRDYNLLTTHFMPLAFKQGLAKGNSAIGKDSVIMPGVFIGENVVIGNNCIIHPNVVIYDQTTIGNNVIIHANTTIGSNAFYYKKRGDQYEKMHSCGRVIIHDHVEIGSGCAIDKGVSSDTIIGEGTKIDNLVHIGHDVVIGKNCLVAAQVGIAGVVTLEDNVTLWGQVGVQKDLTIGKGAVILGQSGVPKSIAGNKTYFGSPIQDAREKMKELALVKRLPELIEKIKKL